MSDILIYSLCALSYPFTVVEIYLFGLNKLNITLSNSVYATAVFVGVVIYCGITKVVPEEVCMVFVTVAVLSLIRPVKLFSVAICQAS